MGRLSEKSGGRFRIRRGIVLAESFQIDAWRNESGIIERLVVDGVELDTSDIVEFWVDVGAIANISVLLAELDNITENMEDENGRVAAINETRDWVDGILAAAAESENEERNKRGIIVPFPYPED